ncbi:MAG: hypothetical protein HY896_09775 [Deltaproteobacteria bacterium]|nr:hypothetical protein [Deltaproteobacteria bacterium]
MADLPPLQPEDREYATCPYCTLQIAVDAAECPHCRKILPPGGKLRDKYGPTGERRDRFRLLLAGDRRFGRLADLWTRYGRWIKVAGPVLAGFATLFLVYGVWVDYNVSIVPNATLPVEVKKDKRDQADLLTVFVTNRGEDIPDLSLKSIGIVVEFVYRDGRRERKTVFPKAEHHGEGAMLNGETGKYEIAVPSKGLKEVILRSEVVDLGMGRTIVPSGVKR